MKKTIIVLSLLLAMPFAAGAQATQVTAGGVAIKAPTADGITKRGDSIWTYGGVGGLNVSQTAVSNWAAGGENAVALNAMFNYGVNMNKGKHLWQNRLELAYGMSFTESGGMQKTNDKIYLASMYGYNLGKSWYVTGLLNFQTQFANGFNYKDSYTKEISQFMAPGYLSIGAGFTWKPKKWFNLTLSPSTWRGTFVYDDNLYFDAAGARVFDLVHGVPYGKHLRNEFGANVQLEINYDIWPNVNIYTRLDLYSDYLLKPQNVDVRWDVILTAKVNKWLAATLTVNMIYDDDAHILDADGTDEGPKFQVKEVLGLGLQAAF